MRVNVARLCGRGAILSLVVVQANQVALQHGNSDLSNCWNIDGSLLLDLIAVKVLEGGKVDADSSIANQVGRNLVRRRRDTGDDNVRERENILDLESSLRNLVWVLNIVRIRCKMASTPRNKRTDAAIPLPLPSDGDAYPRLFTSCFMSWRPTPRWNSWIPLISTE